jgi:lipopolysaccharide/colanic/teichoic acid biosynthesis glycosyltransferase
MKRALDIVVASLLLVLLTPLALIVAALITLNSSGPVLFRQRRLGRDLRPFSMLKFRTMEERTATEPTSPSLRQAAQGIKVPE